MASSIESIVRSLLLPGSGPSTVSLNDFVDRILNSPNPNIRSYSKTVILRVIRENPSRTDPEVANRFLKELRKIFPNDPSLQDMYIDSTPRPVARSGGSDILSRLRQRQLMGSPATRPDPDVSFSSSRFTEYRPPPSTYTATPPRPVRRASVRLSKRLPFSPTRIFRDLSSSSEDEITPSYEAKLRRKVLFQWSKNAGDIAAFRSGLHVLDAIVNRSQKRKFIRSIAQLRGSLEQSVIAVAEMKAINFKLKYYEIWRSRFLQSIASRRLQVDGIKRMVACLSLLVLQTKRDVLRCLDGGARTVEFVRIFLQLLKRRKVGVLAHWRLRSVSTELLKARLRIACQSLSSALVRIIREEMRSGISRLKLMNMVARKSKSRKRIHILSWSRAASQFALRRTALMKLASIVPSIRMRTQFAEFASALQERGRRQRLVRRRLSSLSNSIGRRIGENFEIFQSFSKKMEKLSKLVAVLTRHQLRWSLDILLSGYKLNTAERIIQAVYSSQNSDVKRVTLGSWRMATKLRQETRLRKRLMGASEEYRGWRLAVVIKGIHNRMQRNVLSSLSRSISKQRGKDQALLLLASLIRRKLRQSINPFFHRNYVEPHVRAAGAALVKAAVSGAILRCVGSALRVMRETGWKREIIYALDTCDQYRAFASEKVKLAERMVDRLTARGEIKSAIFALTGWANIVRDKKTRTSKTVKILSRSVESFVFNTLCENVRSDKILGLKTNRRYIYMRMGFSKLEAIFSKNQTKKSAVAFSALMAYRFERTVIMLERVSRSELSAQESVLKELESAARELEADYTALMTKTKRYADKNDVLENDLVVVRSQLEHESKENEMLLLKLNELKINEMTQIEETGKLNRELKRMRDVEEENKHLSEGLEEQRDQLDLMKRKVEEYMKISTSVQFYKNKISLQNEQIVSLQEKLRESTSDIFHANTSPPSDVLYMTSPVNTRSADLTYASSSLRGLQQAVDRSNMLRSRRTSDVSQISNGESTRRRRDLIASRR